MEAVNGCFLDEEWESLNRLLSCEDSNDLLFQFNLPYLGENPTFMPSSENVSSGIDENLCFLSDYTSGIDTSIFLNQANYTNAADIFDAVVDNNVSEPMNFYAMGCRNDGLMVPVYPDAVIQEIFQLRSELNDEQMSNTGEILDNSCTEMQLKRKLESSDIQNQENDDNSNKVLKKKPRVTRNAQKNKKTAQPKKIKKSAQINEDGEEKNVRSSSTYTSENDSNASQELNGETNSESVSSNSNGKARANRGSATDPQSLYARKRRERINERLRILQNLVPNGTKVDISTMLEEAVQYVKFLQLQIKLLSSDDMWMYAPIAYNGMDMGLYQKIVPNLLSNKN